MLRRLRRPALNDRAPNLARPACETMNGATAWRSRHCDSGQANFADHGTRDWRPAFSVAEDVIALLRRMIERQGRGEDLRDV